MRLTWNIVSQYQNFDMGVCGQTKVYKTGLSQREDAEWIRQALRDNDPEPYQMYELERSDA